METIINLLGGVALLLWGARMVRTGFGRAFGSALRRGLSMSARNRFTAFLSGLGVTTVLQSSTATAIITAGFVSRGLLTVLAGLAIMLGADIGTTAVVQLFSLDIRWLSPLLIVAGVAIFLSSESSKRRSIARTAIGLGLMLLSLKLIVAVSAPLRSSEIFSVLIGPMTDEPLLAIVVAALITWLSHSSVAIVLLIMSLAATQLVSLQLAMALVLGANLGSGLIAFAMTLGTPPAGRRIAVGNLAMRVAGVLAFAFALPWLQPWLGLAGSEPARYVANFHPGFNLALALFFLPILPLVVKLTEKLCPDEIVTDDPGQPRYIDSNPVDAPSVALANAARETLRMGDLTRSMLARSMEVFERDDPVLMKEVEKQDNVVDQLHEAIKLYITRLGREELDKDESQRGVEILSFTTNLEHVGDIIDKNLMELAAKKIKRKALFSETGLRELRDFHERVVANMDTALNVFMTGDLEMARGLLREKTTMRDLELTLVESHYNRVGAGRADSIETSSLHLDVLRDLKRINSHITAVAYPILEEAGELADSRLRDTSEKESTVPLAQPLRPES
ncbi:MAG: Na/Pi cotransporter family protein [Rhodospirillales bacterium]